MPRSESIRKIAAPAIALVLTLLAVYAITASGVLGGGSGPKPTDPPKPTPAPTASPKPTDPPTDGKVKVVLDIATDHDVSVLINDETDTLTGAKSGPAGDGMSVQWGKWIVENIDSKTVRFVWVGLPRDEALTLSIAEVDGLYAFILVQAAPPAYSDAIGFDRVLILTFAEDVSAEDVRVTIEEAAA